MCRTLPTRGASDVLIELCGIEKWRAMRRARRQSHVLIELCGIEKTLGLQPQLSPCFVLIELCGIEKLGRCHAQRGSGFGFNRALWD